MSSYSPRRAAPNVSQYLANLNQIPNFQDTPTQESFGIEEDLALFTNAEFLDNFDLGEAPDVTGVDFGQPQEAVSKDSPTGGKDGGNDVKNISFDEGFRFNDISYAQQPPNGLPPLQISQGPSYDVYTSPTSYAPPHTGDKRTFNQASPANSTSAAADLEASSRAAAEEDKRRRNTAASARFRVKKKQREQALEKTAKEMSDKVDVLENRVSELERENKWLKSLVVEKAVGSKEEVKEMLDKFSEENRSSGGAKKGVGTTAAGKEDVKVEAK